MKTLYAGGRPVLPSPTVTTIAGSIQGAATTYYFWLKGKNRVGYNNPSNSANIVVNDNQGIRIAASTFGLLPFESWQKLTVYSSTTNDFLSSRALATFNVVAEDQITYNTAANIDIVDDGILNLPLSITDPSLLPDNPPNGFRVFITGKAAAYEYRLGSAATANDINILDSTSGKWHIVDSVFDLDTSHNLELSQVTTFDAAPLDDISNTIVPLRYYILNDTGSPVQGNIQLNTYISNNIPVQFNFAVIGYLSFTNYTLDTVSIDYQSITPFEENLALSKPLPINSAVVLDVYPFVEAPVLPTGTFVTVYPKISSYDAVVAPTYFDKPVDDLAELAAILVENIIDGQVRYVKSKRSFYIYDATSTTVVNGNDIIAPSSNPTQGRWLSSSTAIASDSIGISQLKQEVIDALEDDTKVTTINLLNSLPYTIDLDTGFDYFIINCPTDSGITVALDVNATLANNSTLSCAVELRQNTAAIGFDGSITFPGGVAPALSGNGKTDMIVLSIVKDDQGNVRKRGLLSRNDIG